MHGINGIRKLKGLDNINDAYGIRENSPSEKSATIYKPKKVKKDKKPLAKRSAKQKAVMAELKKLYPIFLQAHPRCEIKGPNCQGEATCVHHSEGRGLMQVKKQSSWIASCGPCNSWVEKDDKKARELGLKKSKF